MDDILLSRVAVLESRQSDCKTQCAQSASAMGARVGMLEQAVASLRTDLAVVQTRVAIYAGGGALAGGGVVSLAIELFKLFVQKGGTP